jgi:LemA protein
MRVVFSVEILEPNRFLSGVLSFRSETELGVFGCVRPLEDAIQNARRYYNAIVRDYNAKIESFPDLFVAQKFNFGPREYFELDESEAEAAKKMPKIDF